MAFQPDVLRPKMLLYKPFLAALYKCQSSRKAKKILNFSQESELQLLIKLIHLISSGEIPLYSSQFKKISSSKKVPVLHKLSTKKHTYSLLKSSREAKLIYLYQLTSVFTPLLHCMFKDEQE